MRKTAIVYGAGGFIGSHMVKRLIAENYDVTGYDLKYPEFGQTEACRFIIHDLRKKVTGFDYPDEVYQFAADMGGAGYIFSGEHDADVMHNSAQINLNICEEYKNSKTKIFYASSACMYPEYNQKDPDNPNCKESSAYPAEPDSEYGWEKLFSERLYKAYERNYGLNVRIARFHNIFGEMSCYNNGKEKYPAAICRKVAAAKDGDTITIWGDGKATRSFLYIDECIEGVRRLMESNFREPVNIGSDEMISVRGLAEMVIGISGKKLNIEYDLSKPQGVRGRNSDNTLIKEALGWSPSRPLRTGMEKLYHWVNKQINR
jgi:nucleoside-diphosphate-sugar epimerase